jgi:hypothetical protein
MFDPTPAHTPAPAPDAMVPVLARLLRPLVRLLMRCGVTYPVLADLLRGLYVEVAHGDLPAVERKRSDSRISLRTGVHRKEIRRLRLDPPPQPEQPPAVVTRSGRIIGTWLGVAPWIDPEGRPRVLARTGTGASFDTLVASVTTDVRPRAVLDEWLSQGLVALDGQDRVTLNVAAFIPPPGQAAQLHYFARNLHDHIAAAAANVTRVPPPFLERSVHYDFLPGPVAARLEALGREGAQELLLRINRAALDMLAEPGAEPGAPTRRVNLGIYLFVDDDLPGKGA